MARRHPWGWHELIRRLRAVPNVADPNVRRTSRPAVRAWWRELEERVKRVANSGGIKSGLPRDALKNIIRSTLNTLVSPVPGHDAAAAHHAPEADRDFVSDQEVEEAFAGKQPPGGAEEQEERERTKSDQAYDQRIRRMLRNEARTFRRANPGLLGSRIQRPILLSEAGDPDQPIDEAQLARFKRRYTRLLRKDRELVDLALIKGMTIAEIANHKEMRFSQVTFQLFHLLRRLRE